MVRVKICGVTNWADAKLAIDAGADALGFNFYPPSPRAVTPAQAWGIIRRLPPFVEAVGVFVNWSSEAVMAMARAVRLASVQLHGDESPRGGVSARRLQRAPARGHRQALRLAHRAAGQALRPDHPRWRARAGECRAGHPRSPTVCDRRGEWGRIPAGKERSPAAA